MDNPNPSKPRRILVIDDNRSIHEDFRKILGSRRVADPVLDQVESQLFGGAELETSTPTLEIDSAYQGQEALALVRSALCTRCERTPWSARYAATHSMSGRLELRLVVSNATSFASMATVPRG